MAAFLVTKVLFYLVLVIGMIHLAFGIATKSCNQEDIKSEMTKVTKCLFQTIHTRLKKMSANASPSNSCDPTDDSLTSGIECFDKFTKRCLDNEKSTIIEIMNTIMRLNCSIPEETGSIPRVNRFRKTVVESHGSLRKGTENLISSLIFEKNCNFAEKIISLKSRITPCITNVTKGSAMYHASVKCNSPTCSLDLRKFPRFPVCSYATGIFFGGRILLQCKSMFFRA